MDNSPKYIVSTDDDGKQTFATLVTGKARMKFLPSNVNQYLKFENHLYNVAGNLLPGYSGGYWEFYQIENGAFFAVPTSVSEPAVKISVSGNYFEGEGSQVAAGIIVTAKALNDFLHYEHSRGNEAETERLVEKHYALQDFYLGLEEASTIIRALD